MGGFEFHPNKHIVLLAEAWKEIFFFFLCSSLRVGEKQKNFTRQIFALLLLPLFLARSKCKNVSLNGQMKENQANMSESPCLLLVCLEARPSFSLRQQGSAWVVELLWVVAQPAMCQSASQPVVRQLPVSCCYLCWRAASLPLPSISQPNLAPSSCGKNPVLKQPTASAMKGPWPRHLSLSLPIVWLKQGTEHN